MRICAFILTFFCFIFTNAQVNEFTESELRTKADSEMADYIEGMHESDSLKLRQKTYDSFSLLIKKFPKSENLSFYLYTKGCLADKIEEAKSCFKEVIQINSWSYYVIQSYFRLSWFAVKDKDFKLALQYLDIIEKMEQPNYHCGVELESYQSQLNNIRQECEKGLKTNTATNSR
ncbi:hypothetical protein [Flavobacterium stagni]|uniref:Tetratricopeptide repeat protein n=1 Tax=Flavobacterium stagni TaxID=2506421 RepID=A0A4V1N1W1_9FLAO|nr:hypothetical protein [Flavobacterium stagni]RXR18888.1 hypothetical protein EQG61_13600 [Flavobacterium stagni]